MSWLANLFSSRSEHDNPFNFLAFRMHVHRVRLSLHLIKKTKNKRQEHSRRFLFGRRSSRKGEKKSEEGEEILLASKLFSPEQQ